MLSTQTQVSGLPDDNELLAFVWGTKTDTVRPAGKNGKFFIGQTSLCLRALLDCVDGPLHFSPSWPVSFQQETRSLLALVSLCLTSDNTHTFYNSPSLSFSFGLGDSTSARFCPTHPHTHLMTVRMLLFNPLIRQQGHRGNTWGWRTAASRKYTQLNSSVWNGMKYTGSCPTRVEPACDKLHRQGVNSLSLIRSLFKCRQVLLLSSSWLGNIN